MIAAFRFIADDKLVAIQRTALTLEGEKIGRMMMGPVAGPRSRSMRTRMSNMA